jgi:hypothetical protein
MQKNYIVTVKDYTDGLSHKTLCKNEEELGILLSHINKELYEIVKVSVVGDFEEYKTFCKTEKDLETGGKNND